MGNKYILIEVMEREISMPEFFDTHEEAYASMMSKFKEAMDFDDEDIAIAEPMEAIDGGFRFDDDCCFNKWRAFGERFGQNFDWRIFEL